MKSSIRSFIRKSTASVAIGAIIASSASQLALALPQDGQVTNGNAVINTNGNVMDVNQSTTRADIKWVSFNIAQPETVNFNSANVTDITVNRVDATAGRSVIQDMLNSNHRVAVLNDSGITFTASSKVNVGSLIASTAKDFDIQDGKYRFGNVNSANGSVINQGEINVSDGGYAVLVAPEVKNEGIIKAKLGRVDLAAANGFTIDVNGNGNINYLAGADLEKAIVTNTGTINALGGVVNLRSDKAKNLADSVINLDGVINVDGMDAGVIGTTANGSAILATAHGNINANQNLQAGRIELASATGNINTKDLISVNKKTKNTAPAVKVSAALGTTNVGKVTVVNTLDAAGSAAVPTYAQADIYGGYGTTINGDIKLEAQSAAGGTALLNVASGTGTVTTKGLVDVSALGTRLISTIEEGGNILSTATANFVGANIVHEKDVNVQAYSFHDVKTVLEYLSRNSSEHTSIGYYLKDENGNPVAGEILFTDLAAIDPGALAEISVLDLTEVGFFVIPNGAALNSTTDRQEVTFKQVNGAWVAADAATGTALNGGTVFSNDALNNIAGFNFKRTDTGKVGTVGSLATYTANANNGSYTAAGKVNATSESQAQKSTSTANVSIFAKGDINLNGPEVASIGKSYQTASANTAVHSYEGTVNVNSEVYSATLADSKAKGIATSNTVVLSDKGNVVVNKLVTAEATGGTQAYAGTNVQATEGVAYINDLVGAVTTTDSKTNATSAVNISGGLNGVVFSDEEGKEGYAFTITNGVEQSGRSSETAGPSTITVTELVEETVEEIVEETVPVEEVIYEEVPVYETVTTTKKVKGKKVKSQKVVKTGSKKVKTGTKKVVVSSKKVKTGTKKVAAKKAKTVTKTVKKKVGTKKVSSTKTIKKTVHGCTACGQPTKKTVKKTVKTTKTVGVYKESKKTVHVAAKKAKTVNTYKTVKKYKTVPTYKTVNTYKCVPVYKYTKDKTITTTKKVRTGTDKVKRTITKYETIKKPVYTQKITRTVKVDPSNIKDYGRGATASNLSFNPYIVVKTSSKTTPPKLPDLNRPFVNREEPLVVQKEPATGGGLFCRDVNIGGIPGLCGPAPVREIALAPVPVFASPFKTGESKGKKAQVANLEPASGNKCLSVNGKKVCIEEQIDK